jgi:hypothetical protein
MTSPTPADLAPEQSIESYLAQVTAALPGPARARAGIVAELHGGLLDATAPAARPGRRRGRSAATSRARAPTATASPSAAAACPAKYSPNLGGHPSPAPCRIPRPRTSRPDGSGRAPCDSWDQRCTWPRVTGPPHRPQSPIRYRDGGDTVRRRDCRAREAAGGRTATANQDFLAFFFPILGKRFFTAALTFFCSAGVRAEQPGQARCGHVPCPGSDTSVCRAARMTSCSASCDPWY